MYMLRISIKSSGEILLNGFRILSREVVNMFTYFERFHVVFIDGYLLIKITNQIYEL